MSEKKTLHNVWLIQDKVPIDESADNVPVDDSDDSEIKPKYFAGLAISEVTGNQVSRFEPLSAATKVYKNEKGAKIGARMADKYYESPFITPVFVEYAEFDVPEEPPKPSASAPKEPPVRTPLSAVPESELGGWIALDKLCGNYPLMLRKKVGTIFVLQSLSTKRISVTCLPKKSSPGRGTLRNAPASWSAGSATAA